MWYSAIGYLVTVILGVVVSLLTGPEDPHNLNEDLLSPPVLDLLHKLPSYVKEAVNIPLKPRHGCENVVPKGVVNVTLDVSSEKFVNGAHIETKFTGKIRKISLPV